MYRIRDFGNDMECATADELRDALATHYPGRSVSVVYATEPHGMRSTLFVDVLEGGQVIESYGPQAPVDFEAVEADRQGRG